MTQEEKIKDLEERIAIMQESDSALCADLEHWKKVAAGSKGRNKQLAEENKALHEKIAQITADKERLRAVLTETRGLSYKYLGELRDARIELTDYKAIVEWYNELPWWRKMFLFRLL